MGVTVYVSSVSSNLEVSIHKSSNFRYLYIASYTFIKAIGTTTKLLLLKKYISFYHLLHIIFSKILQRASSSTSSYNFTAS